MPVGLGNAIRWLKYEISIIAIDEAEADVSALSSSSLPPSFRRVFLFLLSLTSSFEEKDLVGALLLRLHFFFRRGRWHESV